MTDAKALAEQIEDWLCEGSCKHFEICNGTETTWCGQRTQQILALFASTAPQALAATPALEHLGNAVYFCADIHPDDRNKALDNALTYYNEQMPRCKVEPSGHGYQRLVNPPLAATPADDDLVPRLEDHGLFNKAERNALFKEAKDEIVRLRIVLGAMPAVGGEALTDEIIDLSLSEFWDVSPRGWNEAQRVAMRKAILTAQPASPLRGRETPYVDPDFDKAGNRRYWEERNAREAAASPPEQPAFCIECETQPAAALVTAMTAQGALEIAANIAEDRGWMGKPYPGIEISKAIRDVAKKGYWTRDSALVSRTAPEPRRSSGEPIREDNYMSNDLDKGSDA